MPTLADLPAWFLYAVGLPLGLFFGSFLNVVVHRLPRDESLAYPGSHCPACGAPIRAYDNVPLLSWLLLRGKARCCGAAISARYLLLELLGGLLAWAILSLLVFDLPLETSWWRALLLFLGYLALGLGMIAAAFIDLSHMYLPDPITLGGTALGIASVGLRSDLSWQESLLGAGLGFLMIWLPFDFLYSRLRGQPGMGLGDAKLVMLAGAWFGWMGAAFTLLAGAVQGTVFTLVIFLVHGKIDEPEAVKREREEMLAEIERAKTQEERRALEAELAKDPIGSEPEEGLGKARIAFGPFLALSVIEYMLLGPGLIRPELEAMWLI